MKKNLLPRLIALAIFSITLSITLFVILSIPSLTYAQAKTFKVGTEVDRVFKEGSREKIIVAGTGDSQRLLQVVADCLKQDLKNIEIEIPNSIGSGGGIKALAAGKADLARVARPLKDTEKNLGLIYQPFAKSPIVFVVHPSVTGLDNLTTQEIVDIYSGKITTFEELGAKKGKIYALTREAGDSSLSVLLDYLPGFKDIAELKAKIAYRTPDLLDLLEKHKNTLGFIPLAMAQKTKLKILKVDEVYPSAENIASGKYIFVIPLAIVHKDKPTGLVKQFIDFLFSEKGQKIITENGAIPIRKEGKFALKKPLFP